MLSNCAPHCALISALSVFVSNNFERRSVVVVAVVADVVAVVAAKEARVKPAERDILFQLAVNRPGVATVSRIQIRIQNKKYNK